jgi:hypothetical protein
VSPGAPPAPPAYTTPGPGAGSDGGGDDGGSGGTPVTADDRAATDRTAAEAVRLVHLAGHLERTRQGRRQARTAAALARQAIRTRSRGGTR